MKNNIRKNLILVFLTIFLLSGCKTNPPVSPPEPVFTYGKVFVTSNIDGAGIFLDNQNTGKVTPDTVTAVVGLRTIKLFRDGYITSSLEINIVEDSTVSLNVNLQALLVNKMVLLEDFANVSCFPCVTTNIITHSLAGFYGSKLHIVKFPTNFPKATDPFYLSAKQECDSRMSYYSIITAPTVIIDGVTRPVSSDSNSIKEAIEAALLAEPEFDISVTDTIFGGNIYIKAAVIPINTDGLNLSDYTLHTAVVEKRIETPTPPGANGETVFYDVLRKMLPTPSGTALSESNLSQTVEYENQVQVNPVWNIPELITVVYIQNKNTKKVLQAAATH